jgi:ketosteroid isomerase-like protein
MIAACGGAADNKPANNANASNTATKPAAAAPTADALLALDKSANEAYFKGDSKFFEGFLSDKYVSLDGGKRHNKAESLAEIAKAKCEMKDWKLDEPQMAMIDADTYVLSYKGTFDGTCNGADGKPMKAPSPVRAGTVYVRNGDKWQAAYHSENLIIDPKNPPKEEPKKEEPKKEEAKKEEAAPTGDANTEALVKIHTSGWEAFKAKDAKKFDEIAAANLAIVDPLGEWISGKDNVIKRWTETMKCEGITKVGVSDGFASALSPTVELLTLKGEADGKCDGQANGPLDQTAVYVKQGDAWKLAFMFESMAK